MRHVLVVEDPPLVAEATARLLTQEFEDVHVVSCGTAMSAVDRLRDGQCVWTRIFLDLAVPGAFGLSLARQVRST